MGEQSSIAGGGREEIATSHNMRDVTPMAAAWYGTEIGGGGDGGGKTTTAQKATAAAAVMVTAIIPRGGGAGYLLGQVSLMTWAVGEVASQPAVGGQGWFSGGGPRTVRDQERECVLCICIHSSSCPSLLLLMGNGAS